MIEIILGIAAGFAGGYIVKDNMAKKSLCDEHGVLYKTKYQQSEINVNSLKRSLNTERENVDALNAQLSKLKSRLRDAEDNADDNRDDISDLKRTIERLRVENKRLLSEVEEYKQSYLYAKNELENLKNR